LRGITLIKEKQNAEIKGRTVADGQGQRGYTNKHVAASPTVFIEALMLTCAIDASENRKIISGAFLQADVDKIVAVIFEGTIVDLLIRTDPIYDKYVHVNKVEKQMIYIQLTNAMYGCIKVA
jgi:hypothetical protein